MSCALWQSLQPAPPSSLLPQLAVLTGHVLLADLEVAAATGLGTRPVRGLRVVLARIAWLP
jgi:hypothetical protein